LRETLGFDARQLTPTTVLRISVLAAETRSFERAETTARDVAGLEVSAKTIERVVHDVGRELEQRRDASANSGDPLAQRPEAPPDLAVVECDGGRIRTREPGHGPGVHRSGEGWREDKNACLIRAKRRVFAEDPQPEPPACFCDAKHVAKIAETEALSVAAPLPGAPKPVEEDEPPVLHQEDWRPKRMMRTVLSSVANSERFGRQMARESKQRRFYEALARAFLGDGLPWNWSIWKKCFRDFTPILDFIHGLSYLFMAAKAIQQAADDAWSQYLAWMRYPEYRREGLPITTAWMESLVKEINYRVKGTEMFWNNPAGAEAILQVRAAALSDDERLAKHLRSRPGCPFTRRPKSPSLTAQTCKS